MASQRHKDRLLNEALKRIEDNQAAILDILTSLSNGSGEPVVLAELEKVVIDIPEAQKQADELVKKTVAKRKPRAKKKV